MSLLKIYLLLYLAMGAPNRLSAQNWLINQLIPQNYNKLKAPFDANIENGTIRVNASITLNSFNVVEKSQTLLTDMILCIHWTDYRLQRVEFTPDSLTALNNSSSIHLQQIKLTNFDSLWRPIVYFRNSLATNVVNPLRPIEYMQIWPDTRMLQYCSRMSVIFICHMKMENFPFDEHYCHFELESFEKSVQKLDIQILSVNGVKGNSKFRVRNMFTGICEAIRYFHNKKSRLNSTNTISDIEGCAFGGIHLVRNVSYYIIRYYCSTYLMVMMGMASFWIPTNAWPARIILTASVLLTLIATSLQGYNEVPANEMVSLYWWLWVCQFLLYMSMLEYVLALSWVHFMNDKKVDKTTGKKINYGYYFGEDGWFAACGTQIGKCIRVCFGQVDHYRDPENRNKVDYFARIIFPGIFMVFVLVYILATVPNWTSKWRW